MTKITIQGSVAQVTAKRVGDDVVIRKDLKKAAISEIHPVPPTNRRVTGKQKPPPPNRRINGKQKSPYLTTLGTETLNDIAGIALEAKKKLKISETARATEQAATIRRDAARTEAIRKERRPMTKEAKKRMRAMNAEMMNPKGNATTEKIKDHYAMLAKLIPKKGHPVPAMR